VPVALLAARRWTALASCAATALALLLLSWIVLGGATWLTTGFWAPDGAYSRFVSPSLLLVWVLAMSRVVLSRAPGRRAAW